LESDVRSSGVKTIAEVSGVSIGPVSAWSYGQKNTNKSSEAAAEFSVNWYNAAAQIGAMAFGTDLIDLTLLAQDDCQKNAKKTGTAPET
jgi:hypothetical protein